MTDEEFTEHGNDLARLINTTITNWRSSMPEQDDLDGIEMAALVTLLGGSIGRTARTESGVRRGVAIMQKHVISAAITMMQGREDD